MEKRFSIVIAALIIISLGIWTYSNRGVRTTPPEPPAVVTASPADRSPVSEPPPPSPTEVHDAAPVEPAVTEPPPTPPKPAAKVARQSAPKPPLVVARKPTAKESAVPTAIQAIVPRPAPEAPPPPAQAASVTQPAKARLGIVGAGSYTLVYDRVSDAWYECGAPTWDIQGMSCAGLKDFSELLPALDAHQDAGKLVSIQRFDGSQVINYVYLVSGPSGPGFYLASFDSGTGRYKSTGEKFVPIDPKKNGVDTKNALSVQFNQAGLVPGP